MSKSGVPTPFILFCQNKVSYGVLVYFRKLPHFRNGFREHFGHNALYEVSQLPSLEPVSRF